MFLALLLACGPGNRLDVCGCPDGVAGHAVSLDGACSCLPALPATPLPDDAEIIELAGGAEPDWAAIDAALADGDVVVRFARSDAWDRLYIRRTDDGPHRLVLDGGGGDDRAIVAGMLTPYEEGPRHRITVRGFEITGSPDKGIYWEAGDDVLIEDVVLHDNRGTPALNLQYSNRSGFPSAGFTVRNSHLYDQRGECLYIGGSEGTDADSHSGVVIENNLIHDCYASLDTKHDGINIKDRMSDVVVHRNVVLHADWGIEVASPGVYSSNVVIDVNREAFQVGDVFSPISDMHFEDNAVIRPGHDGFHFATEQAHATDMTLVRNTVVEASQGGVVVASDAGIDLSITDIVIVASGAAFDGWGDAPAELVVEGCRTGDNDVDFDRLFAGLGDCGESRAPDVSRPAGADGLFFTDDDPWLVEGGAALPVL